MTSEEEDMEAMEDTKVVVDTEAEEGVKERLVEDKHQSTIITVDYRVTSHGTV